jgi:hypothetical protein
MDILKPDLMWIEGRCYRLNIQDSSFRGEEDEQFEGDGLTEEGMLSAELKTHHQFQVLGTQIQYISRVCKKYCPLSSRLSLPYYLPNLCIKWDEIHFEFLNRSDQKE